ncbi:UNVERIFIED_CONTAM: hypothetical protein GTU68_048514 [Idotea baltica]|nr:hypothetical protein [Idotea baltica]
MGRVYDVSKGERFYGPGDHMNFLRGRDGSRAYVSGEFTEEGLTDDITGLSSQDYLGLDDWAQLYNKDYTFKGLLIGRYYNEDGSPTPYNIETQKWIAESYARKDDENQEKKLFPPCNSEWTPESGSRLYCTTKSGGVHRDWVGVPRRLFHPGRENERCGCVKNFGPPSHDPTRNPHLNRGDLDHPHVKEYPGCSDLKKDSCHRPN